MGTAEMEKFGTVAVGEQAEVANAHETLGQNMEQKTAQELLGVKSHAARLVAMGVISPTEGDLAFVHGQKPGVGDGDAVGVAGEVSEDWLPEIGEEQVGRRE